MCHTGKLTQALRAVLWLYMPRLGGKPARSAHNTPRPTYVLSSAAVEAPRVQKNFFFTHSTIGQGVPDTQEGNNTHHSIYFNSPRSDVAPVRRHTPLFPHRRGPTTHNYCTSPNRLELVPRSPRSALFGSEPMYTKRFLWPRRFRCVEKIIKAINYEL